MKELNKVLGVSGETFAKNYLKKKGYKIIEQNYKNKLGEIDIIASKDKTIIFIEVKARDTIAYGRPSEAVNFFKQNKIRKVAERFLIENKLTACPCRFDVIEIVGQELNHIENAF